jgi:tetratricopeptide (TPR) repeat protein
MTRRILTGLLALAAGLTTLMAQQPKQGAGLVPGAKSQGESQAIITMAQANGNPDAVIKAAEELLTKYADTTFKETALYMEADAYRQKHDNEKAQVFAERVLEANPKNFQANLLVGELIVGSTRENDLDRDEKLTNAEKHLNACITDVKGASKPNPQMSDADWENSKKWVMAQAHNDLGMAALARKKYDPAIAEFKMAIEGDPQAAYSVRLASAYQAAGKNQEAVEICDKLLADPQLHPQIRQVAQNIKTQASKK